MTKIVRYFKITTDKGVIGWNFIFGGVPTEEEVSVLKAAGLRFSKVNRTWYTTKEAQAEKIARAFNAPGLSNYDYDNSPIISYNDDNSPKASENTPINKNENETPLPIEANRLATNILSTGVEKDNDEARNTTEAVLSPTSDGGNKSEGTGIDGGDERNGGGDGSDGRVTSDIIVDEESPNVVTDDIPLLEEQDTNDNTALLEDEYTYKTNELLTPFESARQKHLLKNYDGEQAKGHSGSRLRRNIKALEALIDAKSGKVDFLNADTFAEFQHTLAGFSGWGGIKEVLDVYKRWNFNNSDRAVLEELYELFNRLASNGIGFELLKSAELSTLTAFYTNREVAKAVWSVIRHLGFDGKGDLPRILEPSAGIGVFIDTMPAEIKTKMLQNIFAVEKDPITAEILTYLYPNVVVKGIGIEESGLPNSMFDLIISNIPFGEFAVVDSLYRRKGSSDNDRARSKSQRKIQDYFFVKNIDLLRDGGIIAFITSTGTMNAAESGYMRTFINEQCNFLGAIRLPSNTFNENGTSVVTDLIFLQKRGNNTITIENPDFLTLEVINVKNKSGELVPITTNRYFIDNPSFQIGETSVGGLYENRLNVISPLNIEEISANIVEIGQRFDNVYRPSNNGSQMPYVAFADGKVRDKTVGIYDGTISIYDRSKDLWSDYSDKVFSTRTKESDKHRIKSLFGHYGVIKDTLIEVLDRELQEDTNNKTLDVLRKRLEKDYDAFVLAHGNLHLRKNAVLLHDIDCGLVFSIEVWNAVKGEWVKGDIFSRRTLSKENKKASNVEEAILIGLDESGFIVPNRIAELLGISVENIEWGEHAFFLQDGSIIDRETYLSGDILDKLEEATMLAEVDKKYQRNVDALTAAMPPRIGIANIVINIGMRWISTDYYNSFCRYLFADRRNSKYGVVYNKTTDEYIVTYPPLDRTSDGDAYFWAVKDEYNYSVMYGHDLLEHALNQKVIVIKKEVPGDNGKPKLVLDEEAMFKANEILSKLSSAFVDFMTSKAERRTWVEEEYNRLFNRTVAHKGNTKYLTFRGANMSDIQLGTYREEAILKIVTRNGGLVDHPVGAGKTIVMILSALKLLQLQKCRKIVFAVLKSTVGQIANDIMRFAPNLKILVPNEGDFSEKKRKEFVNKISTNVWDIIVLSHEQLGLIPDDPSIAKRLIEKEIQLIEDELIYWESQSGTPITRRLIKGLIKRQENGAAKLKTLLSAKSDDNYLHFGQTGIDHIFVDEAHMFKNLQYFTRHSNIAGMGSSDGSMRAMGLYTAIASLRERFYDGKDMGVTFLSGTPITNSLIEMYTLMRYMIPSELARAGIDNLDSWLANFAIASGDFEFDVTASLRMKLRFREFINVDRLVKYYTSFSDVRIAEKLPELQAKKPSIRGGAMTLVNVGISCEQYEFMKAITRFLRVGDTNSISKYTKITSKDATIAAKGLIATNLANKGSLDLRLCNKDLAEDFGNKLYKAILYIASIYYQTTDQKGVQLVFCNIGVPNSEGRFSAYTFIKESLIKYLIPKDEIQFIHDYNSQIAKAKLYEATRAGDVRILLGSTEKLGTGVNVQDRVCAMHHLDLQWTPAALEQRNGRGIRQGNLFKKADKNFSMPIFVYATTRTLDAYKFELLKLKQTFIDQIRDGSFVGNRIDEGDANSDDSGDSAKVSFATFASVVSGDQSIKKIAKLSQQVKKLETQRDVYKERKWAEEERIKNLDSEINSLTSDIDKREAIMNELIKKNVFVKESDGSIKYDPTFNTAHGIGGIKPKNSTDIGQEIANAIEYTKAGETIGYLSLTPIIYKKDGESFHLEIVLPSGNIMGRSFSPTLSNKKEIYESISRKLIDMNDYLKRQINRKAILVGQRNAPRIELKWDGEEAYNRLKEELSEAHKEQAAKIKENANVENESEYVNGDIVVNALCREVLDDPIEYNPIDGPIEIYDYGKLPDISKFSEVPKPTMTVVPNTNTEIKKSKDDNNIEQIERRIAVFQRMAQYADNEVKKKIELRINVFRTMLKYAA